MRKILIAFLMMLQCTLFAKEIIVTQKDNTKNVELEVGDTLKVVLAGNPTTGYTWQLLSFNKAHLQLIQESYTSSNSTLCGAGGTYTFELSAVAKGTSPISLVYHRSWEKDLPPYRTFDLTIEVK